jgi:hypothetical protein
MEAVGIGCFWFGRKFTDENSEGFSPSEHLKDIKSALESVDNVTNVQVAGSGSVTAHIWGAEDENYNRFFPLYVDVVLSFDIFIPYRLQKEFALGRTADTERFRVDINFSGVMPVAYVHYPLKGTRKDNLRRLCPSSGVVAVRKYLASKLSEHPTVKFDSLGPSPFHAELFLIPAKANSPNAEDLSEAGDGYKTFLFSVGEAKPLSPLAAFILEYQRILSAYYSIIRLNEQSSDLQESVTSGATQLLNTQIRGNFFARVSQWRKYQTQIDEVYDCLLREKMDRIAVNRYLATLRDDGEVRQDNIFFQFIERETRPIEIPAEDIRELLVMLEERRRSYFQNSATLWSGMAGGIFGALLGAIATFTLSSQQPSGPTPPSTLVIPAPTANPSR